MTLATPSALATSSTFDTSLVLVLQDPGTGAQDAPPVVRRGEGPPPPGDPAVQQDPNAQQPALGPDACGTQPMLMLIGFVLIFYFLILRPQQKQEKQRRAMLGAIKKGDRVSTSGGLHGTIVAVDKDTVTLRVDTDVKMTFDRAAVARVITSGEAPATPAGDGP